MSDHGWESSNYDDAGRFFGRPGGDWQGVRPTLDNPMSWSIFMGRFSGISVRVHIFFLLFIIIVLLQSLVAYVRQQQTTPIGFDLMVIMMASLFVIVLIHEFGHCLACRWSGGTASEILMWPLGGLAYCRPVHRWQAHLVTVIGGPLVNVLFFIVLCVMLGLLTGEWLGVAFPNPFMPFSALQDPKIMHSFAHQTLYLFHGVNLLLLLFNLLPIFPLDGGRITQALLWSKYGYGHSMRYSVRIGYVGAILLGIFGFVMLEMMLVVIAIFGGFICWQTNRQVEFTEEFMGFEDDEFMLDRFEKQAEPAHTVKPSIRLQKKAERDLKRQEEEAAELDRILQKIADQGMDQLTAKERKILKNVTDRKRNDT